jgi:hypothetical protein
MWPYLKVCVCARVRACVRARPRAQAQTHIMHFMMYSHKMPDTSTPLYHDINPSLCLQNRPKPTEPTIALGTKE